MKLGDFPEWCKRLLEGISSMDIHGSEVCFFWGGNGLSWWWLIDRMDAEVTYWMGFTRRRPKKPWLVRCWVKSPNEQSGGLVRWETRIWLVVQCAHLEKYESQWEGWHPIYYGKNKNMFQTTNQHLVFHWLPNSWMKGRSGIQRSKMSTKPGPSPQELSFKCWRHQPSSGPNLVSSP